MTTRLWVIIPSSGPSFQVGFTRPALTSDSMSPSCDRIATSASNPDAIARACAPEPLYDSLKSTDRPVFLLPLGLERRQQPSCRTS